MRNQVSDSGRGWKKELTLLAWHDEPNNAYFSPDLGIHHQTGNLARVSPSVLMCRPDYFVVDYAINPWMDPDQPVDAELAVSQWQRLHDAYVAIGLEVQLIDPIPGLPDMVYTANGGFTLGGVCYGAKFAYPQRQPEGPAFMDWFDAHGFDVHEPRYVNEGEGDLLLVGDTVLGGYGFRTDREAHAELSALIDCEVVSLRLVDPHFYHIDTCMTVLGDNIAYYPQAFDEASQAELHRRYPDAVRVSHAVAAELGLNCFTVGHTAVVSPKAGEFRDQLRQVGYTVVETELPELVKGGGSIKWCTLRLRP